MKKILFLLVLATASVHAQSVASFAKDSNAVYQLTLTMNVDNLSSGGNQSLTPYEFVLVKFNHEVTSIEVIDEMAKRGLEPYKLEYAAALQMQKDFASILSGDYQIVFNSQLHSTLANIPVNKVENFDSQSKNGNGEKIFSTGYVPKGVWSTNTWFVAKKVQVVPVSQSQVIYEYPVQPCPPQQVVVAPPQPQVMYFPRHRLFYCGGKHLPQQIVNDSEKQRLPNDVLNQ